MRDFYDDGFNDGFGKVINDNREYPQTDGDKYSYRIGLEDGQRRRMISDELDIEDY